MANCNNPGCGCTGSGGGPPSSCTFTVVVKNACAGAGIAGATVVIKDGVGTTICSGMTDGTGTFTCNPAVPIPSPSVTVTNGGCAFSGGIGCNTPLVLYFCSYTTTIAVSGPAGTTLYQSGIVFSSEYGPIPLTIGTVTPDGVVTAASGLSWTLVFCSLGVFDPCFTIPSFVTYMASFPPDWVDACVTYSPVCGSTNSLALTMFDWTTCYADPVNHAAVMGVDQPLCCQPPCVPVATGAGYYPLKLDARWTSVTNTAGGFTVAPCGLFADDEAVWVTLDLVSDTIFFTGSTHVRILHWSSGCRGGESNFISRPSGVLNHLQPYECRDDFHSTSIDIVTTCGRGSVTTNVTYNRFKSADCTLSADPCVGCDRLPILSCDLTTTPSSNLDPAGGPNFTCSPADHTILFDPVHQCAYTVDIRETVCP